MSYLETISFLWIVLTVILYFAMLIITYRLAESHYSTGILWLIIVAFSHIVGFTIFVIMHTYLQRNRVKSQSEIEQQIQEERNRIMFNFYTIKDERLYEIGRIDYEIELLIKNKDLQGALKLAQDKYQSNDCDFQLMRTYISVLKETIEQSNNRKQSEAEWY